MVYDMPDDNVALQECIDHIKEQDAELARLREENERLKASRSYVCQKHSFTEVPGCAWCKIAPLEKENERLREALEGLLSSTDKALIEDGGDAVWAAEVKAREALNPPTEKEST